MAWSDDHCLYYLTDDMDPELFDGKIDGGTLTFANVEIWTRFRESLEGLNICLINSTITIKPE